MSTNRTFANWELHTRIALAKEEINWSIADPLIEDAKLHWQASGEDPWTACGSPAEFAAAAAAEQPPDRKAALDHSGITARAYLVDMFFVLCVVFIPWSLIAAVLTGKWSVTLTPARLVGSILFIATFIVLFGLPRAIRSSGHPRQAPWALAPIALLAFSTFAAFSYLPHTHWFAVPVLLLDLAAAIFALLQLGPAKPVRPASTSDAPSMTNEEWFRKLDGLLVGRHDLPPARAAELIAETRDHGASSGSALEEFGPVEIYAAEIAAQETTHEFPAWIRLDTAALLLLVALLNRNRLTDHLHHQQTWTTIGVIVSISALLITGVATVLVRHGERRTDAAGE